MIALAGVSKSFGKTMAVDHISFTVAEGETLATDPDMLLMDEPFGALDNVTRLSIHAEFIALEELKRKTIVLVKKHIDRNR